MKQVVASTISFAMTLVGGIMLLWLFIALGDVSTSFDDAIMEDDPEAAQQALDNSYDLAGGAFIMGPLGVLLIAGSHFVKPTRGR